MSEVQKYMNSNTAKVWHNRWIFSEWRSKYNRRNGSWTVKENCAVDVLSRLYVSTNMQSTLLSHFTASSGSHSPNNDSSNKLRKYFSRQLSLRTVLHHTLGTTCFSDQYNRQWL